MESRKVGNSRHWDAQFVEITITIMGLLKISACGDKPQRLKVTMSLCPTLTGVTVDAGGQVEMQRWRRTARVNTELVGVMDIGGRCCRHSATY